MVCEMKPLIQKSMLRSWVKSSSVIDLHFFNFFVLNERDVLMNKYENFVEV